MLRAVQRGEFPPPRQLDPSIDKALEAVCLKAMALRARGPLRLAPRRWPTTSSGGWPTSRLPAWREPFRRQARRLDPAAPHARHGRRAVAMVAVVLGLGAVTAVQVEGNRVLKRAYSQLKQASASERETPESMPRLDTPWLVTRSSLTIPGRARTCFSSDPSSKTCESDCSST